MSVFCSLPESLIGSAGGVQRRWAPGTVVTYGIQATPEPFTKEEFRDILVASADAWMAVCGIRLEYKSNHATANVSVSVQTIDEPGGVLAQAELPFPDQRSGQLGRWFDRRDKWVLAKNPPAGRVDILRVDIHEGGHNWGLGHAPQDGSPKDLMDPRISEVRSPQTDWDIPQMVSRYGKPGDKPVDGGDGFCDLLGELLLGCDRERLQDGGDLLRQVLDAWRKA